MSANAQVVDKSCAKAPDQLVFLQPSEIALIDQALARIGAYGEVHLLVERGRLRFIRTVQSEAVERPKPRD